MSNFRIRLIDVDLSLAPSSCTVRVTIAHENDHSIGECSGPSQNRNLMRLTATATLSAAKKLLSSDAEWLLEDVNSFFMAERQVINVLVSVIHDKFEQTFVGSAFIQRDTYQAVAFATLDAINRFVSMMSPKQDHKNVSGT
jgi:hypothetical protein